MTDRLSWTDLALSASAGGMLSSLLTTPLDVIKTRLQARRATVSLPAEGITSGAASIVRHEGICALWSGLRPALAITVPSTVIYMSAYDMLREHILASGMVGNQAAGLLAGGCSRTLSCLATAPLEYTLE